MFHFSVFVGFADGYTRERQNPSTDRLLARGVWWPGRKISSVLLGVSRTEGMLSVLDFLIKNLCYWQVYDLDTILVGFFVLWDLPDKYYLAEKSVENHISVDNDSCSCIIVIRTCCSLLV